MTAIALLTVGLSGDAVSASSTAHTAEAKLIDADGRNVGIVALVGTEQGVLLDVRIEKLPPGTHAMHIHETGRCEPPFKSAGEHFNPLGSGHGMMDGDGVHAGDLPNIHVASTPLRQEVLAPHVTLAKGEKDSLLDGDGAALVIHQKPDDYRSDPSGAAGNRIACGVIRATD